MKNSFVLTWLLVSFVGLSAQSINNPPPDATTGLKGIAQFAADNEATATKVMKSDDPRGSNDRTANNLRTATTQVSISGAAAPTANQFLKASNSTTAAWSGLASGDIPANAANTSGSAASLSSVLGSSAFPALTGDVTTSVGSVATTLAASIAGAHAFTGSLDKTGQASIVADSAGINSTETVIVKSAALLANRLVAGTVIRATLNGTCTSTAANVSTFAIRIGTAGTTADAIVFSGPTIAAATTGTSIPFSAVLEVTVRTTGAAATAMGTLKVYNAGATGISTVLTQVILPTMTTFNTTTANNIVSVTYKAAASTTTSTFKQAFIEVVNQ